MTQSQAKKRAKVIHYGDIAKRVKSLRESLEFSQLEFAKNLAVSRTQIVAWEKGIKERPSFEKLLELAKWAKSKEDKIWFLRKAGVDLDEIKALFRNELKSISDLNPLETKSVLALPVISGLQLDERGNLEARRSDRSELHISAKCVEHVGSTVGIVVQPETRLLGLLHFPLNVGDLAIVDRTQVYPADFIDPPPGSRRLAAVALPRVPEYLSKAGPISESWPRRRDIPHLDHELVLREEEIERQMDPVGFENQRIADEERWAVIQAAMEQPIVLFGWLSEQRAGGDVEELSGLKDQWRLFFDVGPSGGIALTDWMKDQLPRDIGTAPMLHDARIFGAVVGWIKAPLRATKTDSVPSPKGSAIKRPDCECGRRCVCICHTNSKYPHHEACCGLGSKVHEEICHSKQPQPIQEAEEM